MTITRNAVSIGAGIFRMTHNALYSNNLLNEPESFADDLHDYLHVFLSMQLGTDQKENLYKEGLILCVESYLVNGGALFSEIEDLVAQVPADLAALYK